MRTMTEIHSMIHTILYRERSMSSQDSGVTNPSESPHDQNYDDDETLSIQCRARARMLAAAARTRVARRPSPRAAIDMIESTYSVH